jgi:hypothetical protein
VSGDGCSCSGRYLFQKARSIEKAKEEGGFLVPVDLLGTPGKHVHTVELFVEVEDVVLALVIVVDEVVEFILFYFDDLVLKHGESFAFNLPYLIHTAFSKKVSEYAIFIPKYDKCDNFVVI